VLILSPDAFENLRASMKGEDWDADFEYMIMRIPEYKSHDPLKGTNANQSVLKDLAFDTDIRVPLYLPKNLELTV